MACNQWITVHLSTLISFWGEFLGFETGNVEEDGSPDPWWIAGNVCFVFEDHSGARESSALHVRKARQVASHPEWMRENVGASVNTNILPVLVTPVKKVKQGAVPHLRDVALWPLDEFRDWAGEAITAIRNLRTAFAEPGDLAWRAMAAEVFKQRGLDAPNLRTRLRSQMADSLESVK